MRAITKLTGPYIGREVENVYLANKINELIEVVNVLGAKTEQKPQANGHTHFAVEAHEKESGSLVYRATARVGESAGRPHLQNVVWSRDFFTPGIEVVKPETVQERMQRALAEKPSYEDIERIMASSLKAALASEEASPRFIVREKLDPLAIIAPTLAMGEAAARDMRLADRDYHVISSPNQIKGRLVRGFVVIERDLILNFSAIMQALRPALAQ